MDKKDKIIGILLAVIVISLISVMNPTGQVIKERTTGMIEVTAEVLTGSSDVYVNGEFIETIDYDDRTVPYKVLAGEYVVLVRAEGKGDWVETVNVAVGKTTLVRAWYNVG